MKVEIWHRKVTMDDPEYEQGTTIEVCASGDDSALELAYLHVKDGSLTHMQDPSARIPKTGDIFVLKDEASETHRAYQLFVADCTCEDPKFSPVVFSTETLRA